MNDYKSALNKVIRSRMTEEQVRRLDAGEIVDWIHGLEDEIICFEESIRELESKLSDLVAYCKDGYGDHEADEIINAEKLLGQDYE